MSEIFTLIRAVFASGDGKKLLADGMREIATLLYDEAAKLEQDANGTGTGSAGDTGTGSAGDTGTGSAGDTGTGSAGGAVQPAPMFRNFSSQ